MRAYLDTSIVGVAVFHDPGTGKLRRWIKDMQPSFFWSDFTRGELVSAVSLRVRRDLLDGSDGRAIIAGLAPAGRKWIQTELQSNDLANATDLVSRFELHLKLPDALHIAIAKRLDCVLVSSDRTQLKAAQAVGVPIADPLEILWSNP